MSLTVMGIANDDGTAFDVVGAVTSTTGVGVGVTKGELKIDRSADTPDKAKTDVSAKPQATDASLR
jgi:hypothetical protein